MPEQTSEKKNDSVLTKIVFGLIGGLAVIGFFAVIGNSANNPKSYADKEEKIVTEESVLPVKAPAVRTASPTPISTPKAQTMPLEQRNKYVNSYIMSCIQSAQEEVEIDDMKALSYCQCTLSEGEKKYGQYGFAQLSLDINAGKKDATPLKQIITYCAETILK